MSNTKDFDNVASSSANGDSTTEPHVIPREACPVHGEPFRVSPYGDTGAGNPEQFCQIRRTIILAQRPIPLQQALLLRQTLPYPFPKGRD